MESSSPPLSRLVLLFFCCFAAADARPGFLYTTNRGRCTPQISPLLKFLERPTCPWLEHLCRFWSSRREQWPRMVPQGSTISKVFGSRAFERYRYDLTLLEAASRNDDSESAFAALVKQSTAALLNSYAREGFPYSAWEVKTLLIQALVSENASALQAQRFSEANQACN